MTCKHRVVRVDVDGVVVCEDCMTVLSRDEPFSPRPKAPIYDPDEYFNPFLDEIW